MARTRQISLRSHLIMVGGTSVGLLLGLEASSFGYVFSGWMLGGAIIGVSMMHAFVRPAKRSVWRWLYVLTAPGIASAIAYKLLS